MFLAPGKADSLLHPSLAVHWKMLKCFQMLHSHSVWIYIYIYTQVGVSSADKRWGVKDLFACVTWRGLKWRCKMAGKHRKGVNIFIPWLPWLFYHYLHKSSFLFWNWASHSQGATMLILFTTTEQNRMACGVFDTLASHSALVYDATDTDCWTQNGSTQGHVFVTCKKTSF